MHLNEDDVTRIISDIWNSFLGGGVHRLKPPVDRITFDLIGWVQISGAQEGAVALHCTEAFMKTVMATMFGDKHELSDHVDLEDSLGELTNMTAGNLKALLPGPSYISLPVIVTGTDFRLRLVHSEVVTELYFEWKEQMFVVTVLARKRAG
jgi:chemotaxis protein CheX